MSDHLGLSGTLARNESILSLGTLVYSRVTRVIGHFGGGTLAYCGSLVDLGTLVLGGSLCIGGIAKALLWV
jgi:hypothetical protein